ncbi:hypothetical protein ACNQ2O_03595 [Mycoplasma sp. AA7A]|uniref:hypothetical protein n=1 Tax=Mycoplasma TaxID=2093 RepID=UPI003A86AAF1
MNKYYYIYSLGDDFIAVVPSFEMFASKENQNSNNLGYGKTSFNNKVFQFHCERCKEIVKQEFYKSEEMNWKAFCFDENDKSKTLEIFLYFGTEELLSYKKVLKKFRKLYKEFLQQKIQNILAIDETKATKISLITPYFNEISNFWGSFWYECLIGFESDYYPLKEYEKHYSMWNAKYQYVIDSFDKDYYSRKANDEYVDLLEVKINEILEE